MTLSEEAMKLPEIVPGYVLLYRVASACGLSIMEVQYVAMAPGASWRNKPKLEVWSGEDFRDVPRLPDQGRGDEWWCLPAGVVDEYVAFVKAKIPAYKEHKRINAEKEAEFHKTYASRIYEAVRSGDFSKIPPPESYADIYDYRQHFLPDNGPCEDRVLELIAEREKGKYIDELEIKIRNATRNIDSFDSMIAGLQKNREVFDGWNESDVARWKVSLASYAKQRIAEYATLNNGIARLRELVIKKDTQVIAESDVQTLDSLSSQPTGRTTAQPVVGSFLQEEDVDIVFLMQNWKGPVKKKGNSKYIGVPKLRPLEIAVGFKVGYKRRNALWLKLKQKK